MAKLIIYKNQTAVATIELDATRDYTAGRSPDCDIILDDVVFSRQHFKIFYAQNKWTVQSISKYSQLAINHRESDYFTLIDSDKFTTFSYEFEFKDQNSIKTKPIEPVVVNDDKTDNVSQHDKTDNVSQHDKTFVPPMTSQEWSIGVPYLLLRKENGSTQTMRLEGDYWIMGRDEGCDITIEDPKASREHCEIYHKQKKYFIIDKSSSNGTLLNYKKITPEKETPLKSGDQIQIGKMLYIFEIRDPLFSEKMSNLPVEAGYDVDLYSGEMDRGRRSKKVIKVSAFEKNKKMFLMAGGAFLMVCIYMMSSSDSPQKKQLASQDGSTPKPIDALTPDQKDLVDKSYTLAKTLYTQGKYELALTEVQKIHSMIPEYKDSKEIAQYSKNAIDTMLEQKDIERNEQEQKKLFAKVEQIVEQCRSGYSTNHSSEKLQDCLAPALELDPENAPAAQLLETANQDDMKQDQIHEQRSFYNGQVAQRRKLFQHAETLKRQGKTLDALTAYSRHIASTLPDPERLEEKSKQEVRTLQQKITSDVEKLKSQAEDLYSKKEYKDAISALDQALHLDPQNQSVRNQYTTYSKELQGIVKNMYGDSVLEENLGNIDSAKEKWKKIRATDVPSGEYFKKSGLKLKKYGL
jgi:pSer/pThr/pTyr-binding forkhead associated (FHA) protein/tetratricopeptide (TPR) repeat protein